MIDKVLGLKPRKRGPGPHSTEVRKEIFEVINQHWPVHASEILEHLGLPRDEKKHLLLTKYHMEKLARDGLIETKKVGQSFIAWPKEVEKLRVMHDLMRGL